MAIVREEHVSTTNACKLCSPLGACLAFRGLEGCVPYIHGSQGCSTYIRRYIISHFNEPIDIASSSFSEASTIFGGEANFRLGLRNVTAKYAPRVIGVATSCLTETIGDDVNLFAARYTPEPGAPAPAVVTASTPSYAGTHAEGFHAAARAVVRTLAPPLEEPRGTHVNLLPGMVSPADIRYLKQLLRDWGVEGVVFPDYSDTLDAPSATTYDPIPAGGTPIESVARMAVAAATLECGRTLAGRETAAELLATRSGVPRSTLGMPIGVRETDRLVDELERITGLPLPASHAAERGRLIDAYVDGHKYVFGKRAVVYGEADLVVGLASFLCEIGIRPVLCATGGEPGNLRAALQEAAPDLPEECIVREGVDFHEIGQETEASLPDIIIGNSKGYSIARRLDIPLVRVGFPIHDRLGGQRQLHVGYRGAQQLFDRVANAIIERKQDDSPIGYSYM